MKMLIRTISMMGCLFRSMRGLIQSLPYVPMIFHTSSIHVTSMIGGIDNLHDVGVFFLKNGY